jgi:RNA polymerase sigma factor (TIGR02999 family)
MKPERRDHTLEPAALVNEAYLRLIDGNRVDWQGKTHFFAVAARQMRRVLIDHARARHAQKRKAMMVSLSDVAAPNPDQVVDLLALEEALAQLARASPRQARVFELRFFSGLEVKEIAHLLAVSDRTVKGDWKVARTWLARELYCSPLSTQQ